MLQRTTEKKIVGNTRNRRKEPFRIDFRQEQRKTKDWCICSFFKSVFACAINC